MGSNPNPTHSVPFVGYKELNPAAVGTEKESHVVHNGVPFCCCAFCLIGVTRSDQR